MIRVYQKRCTGCETCVTMCPTGAISLRDGKACVDEERCTACEACVKACPEQALAVRVTPEVLPVVYPEPKRQGDGEDRALAAPRRGPRSPVSPEQPRTPGLIPALGAVLGFAVREVLPRLLTPHLLDLIEPERSRRPWSGQASPPGRCGRGSGPGGRAGAGRGGKRQRQCRR